MGKRFGFVGSMLPVLACTILWVGPKIILSPFSIMALPANAAPATAAPKNSPAPPAVPYDDIAGIIAGLPSPSLTNLQDSDAWKGYREYIDGNWSRIESRQLEPIRNWANTELSDINKQTTTLFYPFGGPDGITPFHFFPNAENYILIGLEPVGNLPGLGEWSPKIITSYLDDVKLSLTDFFTRGYFISHDMNQTLYKAKMDGVIPLICFFLKRNGDTIIDIRRIVFDEQGNTVEERFDSLAKMPKRPYGVRIIFSRKSSGGYRNIYYFSCDISDDGFKKNPMSYQYFSRLKSMTVFLKSASYLLHYKNFSMMRNLILEKSQCILQDDTGIPYRYFGSDGWRVTLFGRYTKPVKDFRGVEQPDLKEAYRSDSTIRKIPFDVGYHWNNNSDSLMLVRKNVK